MKKIEILAPAGSYESFRAALSAGADAVYLGASRFGARAYADNLTEDVLLNAIDEAHILDRKLYLTVNTLFKEYELDELYSFLLPYYRQGLDAVIVQDMGALSLIRECFSDLPVHASTQMTVTGYEGAMLLEKSGAVRVVPARELSYKEISLIRDHTSLEIECFVHGALCYSYSGACLMSSFIGGRSGNRGRCAQPCRLPYAVLDGGSKLSDEKNAYALNTKDICLADDIPDLIRAGVTSFKIEGRMKRPEYTAGVVSVYRKYTDLFLENEYSGREAYKVSREDKSLLYDLFNRDGFSHSYYAQHNGRNMMALENRKQSGVRQNKAEKAYEHVREYILNTEPLRGVEGAFVLNKDGSALLSLISKDAAVCTAAEDALPAKNRPLDDGTVRKQLMKTGGTQFNISHLDTDVAPGMFMTPGQLNSLRRSALAALKDEIVSSYRRNEPVREKTTKLTEETKETKSVRLTAAVSSREQFEVLYKCGVLDEIYVPYAMISDEFIRRYDKMGSETVISAALPLMSRPDSLHCASNSIFGGDKYRKRLDYLAENGFSFLVRSMEDAAFLVRCGHAGLIRLDNSMYTMNKKALSFWQALNVRKFTVPMELNRPEIIKRPCNESELVIYGRVPLMISAQCIRKNYDRCTKDFGTWILKDRKNAEFPVVFDCNYCYNIIYNSVPVSLLSVIDEKMLERVEGLRLEFTGESPDEAAGLVESAANIVRAGRKAPKEEFLYTRGHFNRGIE